jgi:hypothetical protein
MSPAAGAFIAAKRLSDKRDKREKTYSAAYWFSVSVSGVCCCWTANHPGPHPRKDLREPQGALQIPPLRFASIGMTRGERLLFGRVATWMGGVRSGYSAKTADLSTTLSQVIAA